MLNQLKQDLNKLKNPTQAKNLQRFFKTAKGEYGEGDIFLGIKVPDQRKVAKKYIDLSLADLQKLLNSKIHEHRLVGLLILVGKYERMGRQRDPSTPLRSAQDKLSIFNFYLKNTKHINNWDLVDLTAHKIAGDYLLNYTEAKQCLVSTGVLYKLARSKNLWERRIAIIATFAFIHQNQFEYSIKLSKILLHDQHDLIHKAVGWALREVGNRDQKVLEKFLDQYCLDMPRTMLRYAIERLPEKKRKSYLKRGR